MLCKTPLSKWDKSKKGDRVLKLEYVLPDEIEKRSFEIIESELGERKISDEIKPIVMRVIHTSADFDYYDNLCFSENAVKTALDSIRNGVVFVTDTNMAKSGINKTALERLGCKAMCFMSDKDIAENAKKNGTTRATASVDKAATLDKPVIYAVGNAPTALIRLYELIESGIFRPELIIGVPVGFVNVVQSKEMIMESGVPYIVAKGRKG
ncbi:MAG: precorrin-8X methylmutase, partial [Oscillospiraceae bacterium]|nr:precorrin-8X methylmutase [Oscillospiraceae bacterium]